MYPFLIFDSYEKSTYFSGFDFDDLLLGDGTGSTIQQQFDTGDSTLTNNST